MKLIRLLFIFAAAVIVLAFGCLGWYLRSLSPVNAKDNSPVLFTITKGEKTKDIADDLEAHHLIRSGGSFLFYITISGLRSQIKAGVYTLNAAESTQQIAHILASGEVSTNRLVVPEGSTEAQIEDLAAAKGISRTAFEQAASQSYNEPFLSGRPDGAPLEGFLFPDSYQVDSSTTAQQLISEMLDNFGHKLTPDIIQGWKAQGLDIYQGVTLASIVEKEVPDTADRKLVAGIFLARLRQDIPLQSDTTVLYAANKMGVDFSTSLDSPYNTYKNKGLPYGPIDNPGLDSMEAVANPTPSNYLYFWTSKSGQVYYATTFSQHQENMRLHP